MQRRHVHFGHHQMESLELLSNRTGLPVAEHVRRAVDAYLPDTEKEEAEKLQKLDRRKEAA